jgi:hypothetical protein
MDAIPKGVAMKKAVVLGCLAMLLVPALVLAGCGGGSGNGGSTSQTPEQVAKAFWTGVIKGDADATWAMVSKKAQSASGGKAAWEDFLKQSGASYKSGTVEVGTATISGDTATVPVTLSVPGESPTTLQIPLVKENGVWKYNPSGQAP